MRFIVIAAAAAALAGAAYAQTPQQPQPQSPKPAAMARPKIQISPDVPRETAMRCRALRILENVLLRKADRPEYIYALSAHTAWTNYTDPEPEQAPRTSPLIDFKGPLERVQKQNAEDAVVITEIEATPEYKADRLGTVSKLSAETCKPLETVVG